MREEKLLRALGAIDPELVEEALEAPARKLLPFRRWGALAACFGLLLSLAALLPAPEQPAESRDGPPNLTVNGTVYYISPHLAHSDTLPEGFTEGGTAPVGGYERCTYYVDPDRPEWVYVRQEVRTSGLVDESGTLLPADPHMAYVRYVDERLRGKELISYQGDFYISLWSADCYGDCPDLTAEAYRQATEAYGLRMEGEAPEGFRFLGEADFSGLDTLPSGTLASNQEGALVWADPDRPEVLLVETYWHTATREEDGETRHQGFDVYLQYDCPLEP